MAELKLSGRIFMNGKPIPENDQPDKSTKFEDFEEAVEVLTKFLEKVVIEKGLMTTYGNICMLIETENIVCGIITYKPTLQFSVIDTSDGVFNYVQENIKAGL